MPPFEISQFIALFSKIENAEHGKIEAEICRKEELLSYFEHVDAAIKDYLDKLLYASLSEYMNLSEAFAYLKRIIDGVLSELLNVMSGWVLLMRRLFAAGSRLFRL